MDAITPVDTLEVSGLIQNDSSRLRTDSLTKIKPIDENDIRSPDMIEPVVKMSPSSSTGFDVQHVYEAFVAALRDPKSPRSPIGTQDYINGYRELLK